MPVASKQWIRSHGLICQAVSEQQKHYCYGYPPYSPDLAPCGFYLLDFQKPRLRTVTINGRNECITVGMLKGSALKDMEN
ncbi:hypothetical protein TNCV_3106651 [Trichonephila clavipes]|nr:hypothetical protein TNCV_3106651 [Trichonephila clavipes]